MTPTVSVIIPAYTLKRWANLQRAVESARAQTVAVDEVVVCIDHNPELLERARREWAGAPGTPVRVMANPHDEHLAGRVRHQKAHGAKRRFGAGSGRNAGARTVRSEILAYLDDDAWADPDWLEHLLAVYRDPGVMAVGGAPLPDYETGRPPWFPRNFDWVFGCAYEGLPKRTGPERRLIGANMSVRRAAWEALGGFHDVDFDDLDLCSRLVDRYGREAVWYTPAAVVHHHVPAERVSWAYFWRRCFFVNREKVSAFRGMGSAADLSAERDFVLRAARTGRAHVRRGAYRAVGAMALGIALAGCGHVVGRLETAGRSREPAC